jgi:hypothetical protein
MRASRALPILLRRGGERDGDGAETFTTEQAEEKRAMWFKHSVSRGRGFVVVELCHPAKPDLYPNW